ncbi:MAG: CoA transferase [Rhodospirillales bacterium]|jgi:crotonobetainyl-CoA:carnitine CoA-transferase CaiB-like acyl-CoA transferase
MSGRIFEGLKVIDCASFIAAPVAATFMADFGADVVKIEAPGGDPYRSLYQGPGMPVADFDYAWFADNRSKRGICLDLKQVSAREILLKLVAEADVFVTNFPFPVREKLKLRYEDLISANPKLIYASLTAYGEEGEEANKTGFDSTALWARSGLMDMIKSSPDEAPARSAPGMGDHPTGTALFAGIAMALYQREKTGEGSYVSSSLVANGAWWNSFYLQAALGGAEIPVRPHRDEWFNALSNHYRCKDGRWFILALVNEMRQIDWFIKAIDRPDIIEDPRFKTLELRKKNAKALTEILDDVFIKKDWEEWRQILGDHGITFGVVRKTSDIPKDQTFEDAGAVIDAGVGNPATKTIGTPVFMRGQEKAPVRPAPSVGQHNNEILAELGYSANEIANLRAGGAIQDG